MPGSRRGFPELATVSAVRFAPLAVAVFLHGIPAAAATRSRFEPTDLELERAGVLDVDVQLISCTHASWTQWHAPAIFDPNVFVPVVLDCFGRSPRVRQTIGAWQVVPPRVYPATWCDNRS